jgi:hypothetical protein
MTSAAMVDPDPRAMSPRARTYISAGGTRHLFIGLSMIVAPWLYSAAAFIPIFNLLDSGIWAWSMTMVGAVCLAGALTRKPDIARAGMIGSAVLTVVLAAGLTLGLINVWWSFGQTLGTERLLDLVIDRPPLYPAELVQIVVAPPSPFLALVLISLSVKDFTMCAQPLRVPVEDRLEVARVREA